MPVLNPGDTFPALRVALPGGATLELPDELARRYRDVPPRPWPH